MVQRFVDREMPAAGSDEASALDEVYARVNADVRGPLPRLGRRAVWALMLAVREEAPHGGYVPDDVATQDKVSRRAGMDIGTARLTHARDVMRAMVARRNAMESAAESCDMVTGVHVTPHRGCVLR